MLNVIVDAVTWGYPARLVVNGVVTFGYYAAYTGWPAGVTGLIPPGATYSIDTVGGGGTLHQWVELR